ncbi:MAG: TetR/AcrR family transcriptional regulator [Solirubrobacterales bacterium]|nr:TetR/AcrR family transcriptional regulator [Solirubrobacterales bacterium]
MVQASGLEKRPRARHLGPERRRPEILDAALALFLERGYDGTSMESIGNAAGVTKPVVYAAFGSKDELFRELLGREEERIVAEIRAAFTTGDLAEPERTLGNGYAAFLRGIAASPEVYRLIFFQEGGGNAAVVRRVQRGRQAQADALASIARAWLAQRPAAERPDDLANASLLIGQSLVAIAEAGARLVLSDPERWPPDQLGARLGRMGAAAASAA